MQPLNHNEIINLAALRAFNETDLCKRLYDTFNSDPIITMLRNFIRVPIEDFCVRASYAGLDEILWVGVMRSESKLGVWRFADQGRLKGTRALEQVVENSYQWTASDCSDLIRLFGAFVENEALLDRGHIAGGTNLARKAKRPGAAFIDKGSGAQRARSRGGYYSLGEETPLPHIGSAHHAVLTSRRVPGGFAGFERCTLKDGSTVKRIDSVFGLAEGCGISGTTADSMFFMGHVGDFLAMMDEGIGVNNLPFIQLLPLATMGSQGHHTVLECALTLTLNDLAAYRVGFYSTLAPTHGTVPQAIRTTLDAAERTGRDKHMICWWNSQRTELEGIRLDNDIEIGTLRRLVLMNETFRNKFNFLPIKHTEQDLIDARIFEGLL
jgi:hypothetical protein